MEIFVIGEGCKDCNKLYENTLEAIEELGINVETKKIEDLKDIVKLGVYEAPSLMIDGRLVVAGRVAKKKEIIKLIAKANN